MKPFRLKIKDYNDSEYKSQPMMIAFTSDETPPTVTPIYDNEYIESLENRIEILETEMKRLWKNINN